MLKIILEWHWYVGMGVFIYQNVFFTLTYVFIIVLVPCYAWFYLVANYILYVLLFLQKALVSLSITLIPSVLKAMK